MRGLAEIQHRGFDLDEATFGHVESGLRALAEVFRCDDEEIEDQSEVAADTCCAQNFKGHARPASPRSCPGSACGPLRTRGFRPTDAAQEIRAGRRLSALARAGVPTPAGRRRWRMSSRGIALAVLPSRPATCAATSTKPGQGVCISSAASMAGLAGRRHEFLMK